MDLTQIADAISADHLYVIKEKEVDSGYTSDRKIPQ